jgi:hypothetical protein
VFKVFVQADKKEHTPHVPGPSSLDSMSVPLDEYKLKSVSPVHTASG